MKIGYARVSTTDQNLELQLDALNNAGCDKIFKEKVSAVKKRPELNRLFEQLRPGDVVYIYKLDRLGRSLKHLLNLVEELQQKKVALVSLSDKIDTSTPQGKLIFHIFSALAEFEKDLIRERTKAGLIAARARGRIGGRPKGLSPESQKTAIVAETLYKERKLSIKEIIQQLGIAKSTFYKYLKYRGVTLDTASQTKK